MTDKKETNSGHYNSGHYNSGHYNSGHYNSGHYNSGYLNSGNYNSGDLNSGNYNSGDCNSGNYNSGDRNSGYLNSGNYNSGDLNSGDYNSGDYNSGDCNTNAPKVRIFNNESGFEYLDERHQKFRLILYRCAGPLCEWISETNMTEEQKKISDSYKTTGGILILNKNQKKKLTDDEEKFIRSINGFTEEILFETTGIDLRNKKVKIIVDGKEIEVTKEVFEDIKRQFLK